MHSRLDQAKYFFLGRVKLWVWFKDIQLLISDRQTQVYTRCCCAQNRVQFYSSVRLALRTPSDWLGGSVLGLLLLSYTHIMHTYISDPMHQVVAGSEGNTIDLASLSMGINEEYIKVLVPLKHSTKALNTTTVPPTTHGKSYHVRTPHIHTESVAANQLDYLLYNIQERLRHWLVNPIHYHHLSANTCDVLSTSTIPRMVRSIRSPDH